MDTVIPVDVYVPGCAARPQAIIDGVVKALEILDQKRRDYAQGAQIRPGGRSGRRKRAVEYLNTIEPVTLEQFMPEVVSLKMQGWHVTQLCAARVPEGYELSYTFGREYDLRTLRLTVAEDQPVSSITQIFPSAFLQENEAAELFGVKRSKTLRRITTAGCTRISRETPFKGKGVRKHGETEYCALWPAASRPFRNRFTWIWCSRTRTVVKAVPSIGFVHRGLEKLVELKDFKQYVYIAERVCGICSFGHGLGYCQCVEDIMGVEVPRRRAAYLRTIWMEMSRVHSHLLWLGLLADALGFESLFMQSWRLREKILDMFDLTTGGRIIFSVNCIGGVLKDMDSGMLVQISRTVDEIERELRPWRTPSCTTRRWAAG